MASDRNPWALLLVLSTFLLVLVAGHTAQVSVSAAAPVPNYRETVSRAVALLPRRPQSVLIIDVEEAKPEDVEHLRTLQAFVLQGQPVVYLTKHGDALRAAVTGSRFHEYMLATVIWHEMAHLEGADESQARRREEELWTRFIVDNVVDRDAALNYLAMLHKRRPVGVQ
jgi:hypothetical protein